MKKYIILMLAFFVLGPIAVAAEDVQVTYESEHTMNVKVHKFVLDNGLTILVYPSHYVPKVMVSMWYNVGSKDEKDAERGIAHLIEHMLFKGNGKTITESDISMLMHKLSASCNATTSFDYTNYYFSLPTHHWREIMPILADVMANGTFDEQLLNSEMKAVIQELKMNRDNYTRSAFSELISAIFPDHPYHFPIIGFKQDLWNLHADNLRAFYKKHYVPNNATLVITGDVDPQEVLSLAREHLESIEPDPTYAKSAFYLNKDLVSRSVTLYREVQHPIGILSFIVPGAKEKQSQYFDVLELLLGNMRSSRLRQKLVNDLKIASGIGVGTFDLSDHGIFYVIYQPAEGDSVAAGEGGVNAFMQEIEEHVLAELHSIASCGPNEKELQKAIKAARKYYYGLFESVSEQAQQIGRYYLSTGDERYAFKYLEEDPKIIGQKVQQLAKEYLRPAIVNKGVVMPLPECERAQWAAMQMRSDAEDNRFLSARPRTEPLQKPVYAPQVAVHEPKEFNFPKPQRFSLSNGITVFSHNNAVTPKIDMIIDFKAKHYFDPEDKQGLYNFMTSMMAEGTQNYSAKELSEYSDEHGIDWHIAPGVIKLSFLREDFSKAVEILRELLTRATFPEEEIEKVRSHIFVSIKNFWDSPRDFISQLIRDQIYAGHPWSKNLLGSKEVIAGITRDDLVNAYSAHISPDGMRIALVGNLEGLDAHKELESVFGSWSGAKVPDIGYPELKPIEHKEINYPINRDQVILAFVGLSVERTHPDHDKLQLFDQIFGQGSVGSMHSRLFALREATGLFYAINGSMLAGRGEQPGMVSVMAIASLDRLKEAEKIIKDTIDTVAQTITPQELTEARYAIVNSSVNLFESNGAIADAFLFLDKYNLPADFFDQRNKSLMKITLQEVIDAASRYLDPDKMITVKVGRSDENAA